MSFNDINDILKDLSHRMFYKDITNEGDVILLIFKNSLLWAVVTTIGDEDENGVREVMVKLLSLPPLEMHFHISNEQLDGNLPFLIENNDVYMKAVDFNKSYMPEDIKEIYRRETEDKDEDMIKVPGSTSVN